MSASYRFECPACRAPIKTLRSQAGQVVHCPKCHSAVPAPFPEGSLPQGTPAVDDWLRPPVPAAQQPPRPEVPSPAPRAAPPEPRTPNPEPRTPPPASHTPHPDPRSPIPTPRIPPPANRHPPPAKRLEDDYFGFPCTICDTRLKARYDDAGGKMTCPDCHQEVTIPARRRPAAPVRPVSEGPDLEVADDLFHRPRYDPITRGVASREELNAAAVGEHADPFAPAPAGNAATRPIESATSSTGASSPRAHDTFAFPCPTCGTALLAQRVDAGQPLRCSDCLTETRVPAPPEAPPSKTPGAKGRRPRRPDPDEEEFQEFAEFRLAPVEDRPRPDEEYARQVGLAALERARQAARKDAGRPASAATSAVRGQGAGGGSSASSPAGAAFPVAPLVGVGPVSTPLHVESAPRPQAVVADRPASPSADDPTPPPAPAATAKGGLPPAIPDWLLETHDEPTRPPREIIEVPWLLSQPSVSLTLLINSLGLLVLVGFYHISSMRFEDQIVAHITWLVMIICGICLGVPLAFYACATLLGILQETANGQERLSERLGEDWLEEWLSNIGFVIGSAVMVAVLVSPLALLPTSLRFVGYGTAALVFPIVLLSALEQGTLLPPFSLSLLQTMRSAPGVWLRGYLEMSIAAAVIAAAVMLCRHSFVLSLLGAPLANVGAIVYFWRIGVLGQRCNRATRRGSARKTGSEG